MPSCEDFKCEPSRWDYRGQSTEPRQCSLSRARSEPKGPVYLWARREVMEEGLDEDYVNTPIQTKTWMPIESLGLSPPGVCKQAPDVVLVFMNILCSP